MAPGELAPWLAYAIAAALTLGLLLGRVAFGPAPGDLPLLILFTIPIIVSAYLGGLGPGLLATAIAALGTAYFLLLPSYSLFIDRPANRLQWSILIASGALVSLLTEALHRSRRKAMAAERLKAVTLSSIGDAVIAADTHGRITFLNAEAERLTGWTDQEAKGRPLPSVFRIVSEDSREPAENPVAKVLRLGAVTSLANHTLLIARDGREWPIDDRGAPIKQADGTVEGIVLVFRDCSAEKKAETALKQAQELQLRSQKLEALGTLAGGIAHDFNNVLLAINGNAKLALAELAQGHPARTSAEEIAKAGTRAADLVRRILAFSRPQELKIEVLEPRAVIEEALKLLRPTLPATLEIRAEFAADAPAIAADASQIHRVIVNLATNAAHAIGGRAGLIHLRLEAVEVSADAAGLSPDLRAGRYCRLSLSDDGSGMDRATLPRIFDPFFTTKPAAEGTGLGLSVVHGIMKNHRGAVTVYSQPGKGSTFHLYFPAAAGAPETQAGKPPEAAHGRGKRVLYVDDDEALVSLAVRVLENIGYVVTGHTEPARALTEFRARPRDFDAIVTDLSMPQMSGFDLARELLAVRPDVPIVMTSGYLRPEEEQTARRIGIRELILKPDTVDELGRALDRLLPAI